jgi:PST family polysaccharide transporter|tara:strand:- start:1262 stop:2509 length:1248 start_codon:yes stop_codon:yes gene_type:complete
MNFIKNKDYNIIIKNFSFLSFLKFFNIGFKFILIAYLIRIFGTELYGVLTWADSIIQFFLMFINFGFNVYAAKYIVDHRNDKQRLNEVVSSIYIIKFLLFVTSFLLLYLSSFFNPIAENLGLLYLLLLMGVGEVFFPIWFFQGIEKLKTATIIVFFSRLFVVGATFLFVKLPSDLLLYVGFLILSNVLMGALGVRSIKKQYNIKLYLVKMKTLFEYFKAATMFFLGRFLSLVFNFGTIFLIGIYSNMNDVTGFDTASKIIMLTVIPFEMLQQAVFPTISRTLDKKLLLKLIFISLILGLFLMLVLNIFALELLQLFGGLELLNYVSTLKCLSLLTPLMSVTFILGSCALVAFGFFKEYNRSLIISSLIYVFCVGILYFLNQITFWNLIYLRVFSDFILVFIRGFYVVKKKVLSFK